MGLKYKRETNIDAMFDKFAIDPADAKKQQAADIVEEQLKEKIEKKASETEKETNA